MGALWQNDFVQQPPFFATKGLSFLNAGNDLIYSASLLYKYDGDAGALTWAKRLAEQYVLPRDKEDRARRLPVYPSAKTRRHYR